MSSPSAPPALGFITVCEDESQGYLGGYLTLNTSGRPLEFYCTSPVRPNRAQEVLYGDTLKPYLYGEQIGQALLDKAKVKPLLVLTDVEPALAARSVSAAPVAWVSGGDAGAGEKLHYFRLADQRLAVLSQHSQDEAAIADIWKQHAQGFDLAEPFGRIREAIEEARHSVR